jgi:hypothetical protein
MESAHQQFTAANSKRIRSSRGDGTTTTEKTIARTGVMLGAEKVLGALADLFFFQRQQAGGERNFTFQRAPRTKFLSAIAPAQTRGAR